jgi:hypothetical protein
MIDDTTGMNPRNPDTAALQAYVAYLSIANRDLHCYIDVRYRCQL